MAISRKLRAKLNAGKRDQALVSVKRALRHSTGNVDGFVVEVGRRWAVLAKVADGGWFDGYIAIRLSDIVSVKWDQSVSSAFSRTRPEWPPAWPFDSDSFDDATEVIRAFGAQGRLIGIKKERERSAIWIGVLEDIWPKWVWLQEVDYQAVWATKSLGYKLKSISAVTTGDRYMQALVTVAGTPPVIVAQGVSD